MLTYVSEDLYILYISCFTCLPTRKQAQVLCTIFSCFVIHVQMCTLCPLPKCCERFGELKCIKCNKCGGSCSRLALILRSHEPCIVCNDPLWCLSTCVMVISPFTHTVINVKNNIIIYIGMYFNQSYSFKWIMFHQYVWPNHFT